MAKAFRTISTDNKTAAARCIACALLLLACVLVPRAGVAQAPPPGVFSEIQTAVVARVSPALEPATLRTRVVQVDTQKITAARRGREVLKLNLFDDAAVEVAINRVRPTRSGYFISGAPKGMEWGEVRLVVNGPVMVGTVETPEGKFTIRSGGAGRHVIRQIDPTKESFECEMEAAPIARPAPQPSDMPAISSIDPMPAGAFSSLPAQAEEMPTEDGSEIRMLIAYTSALQAEQGGPAGMRALIDLFIASANQAFEDSGVTPRLVLAHAVKVEIPEARSRSSNLRWLQDPADGYMDEVHSLRNEYAADLVHLLASTGGSLGSVIPSESLAHEDSSAFAVTGRDSEFVFVHETGHNLGITHDRYVTAPGVYPYAVGYVNKRAFEPDAPRSAGWLTVMSYPTRCGDANVYCERLHRFSNPDQTFRGDPLGVPADSPVTGTDGPADARLTINNIAPWIGSFRSEACTEFVVTPEGPFATVGGGEVVIKVDAAPGCLWEASSQAEFLAIASDALSAGPGFVNLTANQNRTGAERSGTVMIAGKTITVRQLASDQGVCGRTPAVAEAITKAAGFTGIAQCGDVTAQDLAQVTRLYMYTQGLGFLREGDLDGLTALKILALGGNKLTELPEGLFNDLSGLESLELLDNQLTRLPAGIFAGLSRLDSLLLRVNQLAGLPDGIFADLTSLEYLDLGTNRLTRLPSDLFAGLSSLEGVVLSENQLGELPPGIFSGLSSLESLSLSSNRLTRLPDGIFSGLTSLESLELGSNELTLLPSNLLQDLSNLNSLSLRNNRLSDLPEGIFLGHANLKDLRLDWNRFEHLSKRTFAELSGLEILVLNRNRFVELSSEFLGDLPRLKDLVLAENQLKTVHSTAFSGLPALEQIFLNSNQLSTLPKGVFSGLPALEQVFLQSNQFRSIPEGVFAGLTKLKTLYLGYNPLDPLPLSVALEKMQDNRFKAIASAGAPFELVLPLTVNSAGRFEGVASTVTIPAGAAESESIGVTRVAGTEEAVKIDFGDLPNLPADHTGYVLKKDEALPLQLFESMVPADAALIALSIAESVLEPAFENETTDYRALVPHAMSTVTVTPTRSNAQATVAFLDTSDSAVADADPAVDGHQVSLHAGENTIRIRVTSEDATSTQSYTLVITRDSAANVCSRTRKVRDAIVRVLREIEDCSEVTAADLLKISHLNFVQAGLESLKAHDFAGLAELRILELGFNRLSSLPAEVFADLAALETLRLDVNSLSNLPPDVFSGLPALKSLGLAQNRLSELPAGVFSDLTSLERLVLYDNRLSSLSAGSFSGLSALQVLDLFLNPVSSVPADLFSELGTLRELSLSELDLESLPPGIFSDLPTLQSLALSGNRLTSLPPDIFSNLPALQTLRLSGNRLTSLQPDIFSDLDQLEHLDLRGNQLRSLPSGAFSGLSSLRVLRPAYNRLESLPPGIFSGLSALEVLELDGNYLRSLPDGIFSGLSSLRELELEENAVDPLPILLTLDKSGDSEFKAAAPTGAPFMLSLPFHISDAGEIESDLNIVTIPAGALESAPLAVTRVTGTEDAVTVDLGASPGLPKDHSGYIFRKDGSLPRVILPGPKAPPPAQATGVQVSPGAEQLEVSWAAVSDANGYKVQWRLDDQDYGEERQSVVSGGDVVNYTILGLTAGTEYSIRIIATKENADDGPPSEEVTGTPLAMPALQVQDVEVTAGIEQMEVSWSALPEANGYKVQWKSDEEDYADSRQAVLAGGDNVSYTITGLDAGSQFTVRVIATRQDAEDGAPSIEVLGVPKASPAAQVTDVEITVGVERLDVSWTAASNADGYKVQWKSGAEEYEGSREAVLADSDTVSYTITGLTAGTDYTLRVLATRANADDGSPSSEVTSVPLSAPPAQVTGLEVTVGVEQLDLSWDAVSGVGGYKVQWKSGDEDYDDSRQALLSGGETTSYTITDLVAGTEYTVRVIATKAHADEGAPSDEATGVPKASPPAQVTSVAVEPGFEELEVSWDAASDADGYKVQWKSGTEEYDEDRQVALLGGETTTYTIIDLTADTEYTIRVIGTREHADDGAPSEEVTATPVSADPDVNGDGMLDGNDALILYHSYASEAQLGDGETGGTAASRQSLLAGYAGKDSPSDDELKEMIRKANAWQEVGVDVGGDINEDGVIDESDAFVMYYAYANANLVGDGNTGGTARFRQLLLAAFANKDNPTDEDLRAMLRRANKLKEEFG